MIRLISIGIKTSMATSPTIMMGESMACFLYSLTLLDNSFITAVLHGSREGLEYEGQLLLLGRIQLGSEAALEAGHFLVDLLCKGCAVIGQAYPFEPLVAFDAITDNQPA